MSIVTIRDVTFLNNPARFSDEYKFRVTFECISPLKDDLEWKLIFVSSPDSEQYDQELDDCMVGPVPVGINSFTFSSPPPDPSLIPPADVLGVAAIILTASYRDQEFVRVGYYQNTEYDTEELRQAVREAQERGITNSPILWDRLVRELADKPRVTRFTIKWDTEEPAAPLSIPQAPFSSQANPSSFGRPPSSFAPSYVNNDALHLAPTGQPLAPSSAVPPAFPR
ncbi:hypothetical protein BS47DRAFT_1392518 [Hydnum rufescens UP504]|uniref:Anti-silencing function protein 1 n=1 Tax=Hydnum rufescens UP504 TaxID=1448309 RepID=A0A9P6AYK0_9AGAM|nr:hypothetical protein BS47DRAFT_1392518 [Hydnum rufescens UP504]